jgi:hypothetical protein
MPIPNLDENGLLPPGIYDCSLEEVEERFGTFQSTDRRYRIYEQLQAFLAEVRSTNLVVAVIINGSFVTSKHDPGDVDLILVLSREHDFNAELRPFEYNVLSRRRVRKRYEIDVLIAREDSLEYEEYTEFFQQVRGQVEGRKGILRLRS